jgi:NADPH-dependent 2,4-dienoyl-CoA reductase/sulfur reductase-like enzyme
MSAKKIIVIGGSAAGPKAASKARRMDENAEITIYQKASDLSMASCGYPYYIGGFFDDRNQLLCSPSGVVRDSKFFLNAKNITTKVNGENGKLTGVKLQNGTEIPCELAVIAIGVVPNTKLAKEAGLPVGNTGGIVVDDYMQTADPDIYAVGDCIEIPNLLTGNPVHAPYGDLANLQGRVVGENVISGNVAKFPGTIQTGICKVFDYGVGATGLSEQNAGKAGLKNIETVVNASLDKPGFMQGKLQLRKRLSEMPEDKNAEIITWCKISLRGYEAALVLQSNGYQNVKVLEGGIMAWPYKREK